MYEPSFRFAKTTDIEVIVALVQSAYRGEASRAGWTTEVEFLDGQRTDPVEVGELLTRSDSRMLLAEKDGRLLACCHLEKQGTRCYFGMFAVVPGMQGAGLGRHTLDTAEHFARVEWGCHSMEMQVIDLRVKLIAWYERCGYRRSGIYQPFPYDNARFGLPKQPNLRFEMLCKTLVFDSPQVVVSPGDDNNPSSIMRNTR